MASIVAHCIKMLVKKPASHGRMSEHRPWPCFSSSFLLMHFGGWSWAKCWVPATHMGVPDGLPGFGMDQLWLLQAQAKWTKHAGSISSSLSLSQTFPLWHPAFQLDKSGLLFFFFVRTEACPLLTGKWYSLWLPILGSFITQLFYNTVPNYKGLLLFWFKL